LQGAHALASRKATQTVAISVKLFLMLLEIEFRDFLLFLDVPILLSLNFVLIVKLFNPLFFERVKLVGMPDQLLLFLQSLVSLVLFLQVFVIHLGYEVAGETIFLFLLGDLGLRVILVQELFLLNDIRVEGF
jgi:hypothetical protein